MLRATVHRFGRWYIRQILASEATAQVARPLNERPVELSFLFEAVRELQPRRVLDVGTGLSPLPALLRNCGCEVNAVDNISDYWPNGMVNRHWQIINDDIRSPHVVRPGYDLVACISVIEHIEDPDAAFRSMVSLLSPGGHLVLTCPYNERRYVEDVYKLPGGDLGEPQPYRCASYNRPALERWLAGAPAQIVRQEYWSFWSGEVWRQGARLSSPTRTSADGPHQITCLLIRRVAPEPGRTA